MRQSEKSNWRKLAQLAQKCVSSVAPLHSLIRGADNWRTGADHMALELAQIDGGEDNAQP